MENEHTTPDSKAKLQDPKQLLRHRVALANIQAANNYREETPTKTINEDVYKTELQPFTPRVSEAENVMDIFLYKDPAVSFLVILVGGVSLATMQYITSGPHHFTFLSGICYAMLIELAFNSIKSIILPSNSSGTWENSPMISSAILHATTAIQHAAQLHDTYLTVRDPITAMKIGASLWIVALSGYYLSTWTLITLAFIAAFTIPYSLQTHGDAIETVYKNINTIITARWRALRLSRKQKILGTGIAVMYVWMNLSWASRGIAMLMAVLAVRCTLKPAEVASLREHAAPLTLSVKKKARKFSVAATDYFNAQRAALGNGNKTPHRVHFR